MKKPLIALGVLAFLAAFRVVACAQQTASPAAQVAAGQPASPTPEPSIRPSAEQPAAPSTRSATPPARLAQKSPPQTPLTIEERLLHADLSAALRQYEKVVALQHEAELQKALLSNASEPVEKERQSLSLRAAVLHDQAQRLRKMATALDAEIQQRRPPVVAQKTVSPSHVVGVGMALGVDERTQAIQVTKVLPNSPAAAAGVSAGSVITKVDGMEIAGTDIAECVRLIRGAEGTMVTLEMRDSADTTSLFTIRREPLAETAVDRR